MTSGEFGSARSGPRCAWDPVHQMERAYDLALLSRSPGAIAADRARLSNSTRSRVISARLTNEAVVVELYEAKSPAVRKGLAQRAEADSELTPHAIEIDFRHQAREPVRTASLRRSTKKPQLGNWRCSRNSWARIIDYVEPFVEGGSDDHQDFGRRDSGRSHGDEQH
jgi:hypothetical protein